MDHNLRHQTLSEALRIVKEHVALNWRQRHVGTKVLRSYYICFAANRARAAGRISAANARRIKKIVQRRLGRDTSLERWLAGRGIDLGPEVDDGVYPRVQLHRHAWLDRLAEEFEP